VPHARNTIERVDFVPAVKELNPGHASHAPSKFELFGLELVVILPFLEKTLQKGPVRNANLRSNLKLSDVQTSRLSQGAGLRI
jgi:hypothetical protein